MRRVAVTGFALLALAGGLLLWRGATHRRARAAGSHAEKEPATSAAETSATAGETEEVDIYASVKDERGLTLSRADGTVRFTIGGESAPVETEISGGTWRWTVHKGSSLTFEAIEFGGRKAVPLAATAEVPGSGVMEIRCRWLMPTRLRVIGERDEDLKGVEVVETDAYVKIAPPADADRVVVGGTSPIELNGAEDARTFWARAPGYAWAHIMVSVGFGGERVLRLVPGGAIHVHLTPYDPNASISVQVTRGDETHPDEEPSFDPDETGHVGIDSLPPGALRVEAYSDAWGEPHTLASADVRIEAHRTAELTLALGEIPAGVEPVRLEGTFRPDPLWPEVDDDSEGFCDVRPNPALSVVPASGGCFHPDVEYGYEGEDGGGWFAGSVRPGRYFVLLADWSYAQSVDVGSGGKTDVEIVVPPPCDVEVHLVDAATGEPVAASDNIGWAVKAPDVGPEFGRAWLYCEHDEPCTRPGVYAFRAPLGTLVVMFWSDLHSAEDMDVPLQPGLNRIDLKVVSNFGVDLALRDVTMPVPVDSAFTDGVEATQLDGEGELDWCGEGDPFCVRVTKPGRYRITLPAAIEGYEPIAPIEVDVPKGRIPRIEVLLQRRDR